MPFLSSHNSPTAWMELRPSWRALPCCPIANPPWFLGPPGQGGHLGGRQRKPRLSCLFGGISCGQQGPSLWGWQWPVGCFFEGTIAPRPSDGCPLSTQVTPVPRPELPAGNSGLCGIAGSSGFEGRPVSPDRLHLVCSEGIYGFIKLLNWLFSPLQNISPSLQGQF